MKRLNLLFIIDHLETLHLDTDTTFQIMAESNRRGHSVWIAHLEDLTVKKNIATGHCVRRTFVASRTKKTWNALEQREIPLNAMNVVFMRKDPPFSIDYVMATYILSLIDTTKTFVINSPAALRNFSEKMGIFYFPQYIAPTLVTKHKSEIIAFLKLHKTIVLKPLEGFGGSEVVVVDKKDKNRNTLIEILTQHEKRYIMAQKYLPKVSRGDKRILILNGKVLGQHNRVAQGGDHRSNISAGGKSEKTTLSAKEKDMCEVLGGRLKEMGIYFAGLDVIGGYLTEINVTSPTGIVKINEHEGVHLEKKIVDFLESASP